MNKNDILRLTESARNGQISFEDYVNNINLFTEDASVRNLYNVYLPGFKSEKEAPLELMDVLEYAKKVTIGNEEKYFDLVEQVIERDTSRFNAYAGSMIDLFEEGHASINNTDSTNDDVFEECAAEFNRIGNSVYGDRESVLMTEAIRLGPITISKTVKNAGELTKLINSLGRNTKLLESKDATAVRSKMKAYEELVASESFIPLKDLKKIHKSYEDAKKELRKVPKFNSEKGDVFTCYIWYKGNEKFCGISIVENKNKYIIKPEIFGGVASNLKSYYMAAMALSCGLWTADTKKCLSDLRKSVEKGWQVQKKIVKESVTRYFDNPNAIEAIHNYYQKACDQGMILEADLDVYNKLIDNMYKEAAEEKEKEDEDSKSDDSNDESSTDDSSSNDDSDSSDDSSSDDSSSSGKQPTKNQKEKLDDAIDDVKDLTDDPSKTNIDKAKKAIQDALDELKIKSQTSMDTCKDYFVNAIGGDSLDEKWTDLCDDMFVVSDDDSDDDNKDSKDSEDSSKDSGEDSSEDDSSKDSDDSSEEKDTEESVFDFFGDYEFDIDFE